MINAGTRVYHVDENDDVVEVLVVSGEERGQVTIQLHDRRHINVSIFNVFNSPTAANIAANARKTDAVVRMMKARKAGQTFIKG